MYFMQRYGQIIGIKPEAIEEYKLLHAAVWPAVLATIHACNMRNYSIFLQGNTLFAYFEYIGTDFAADMAKMAQDPETQRWWTFTDPLQEPREDRVSGEWWTRMEEVFHVD
jgi:L-rhamnose mutarotase